MDPTLATASVSLGTTALDTMFVSWLRSMGIVTQQKWIAVLALAFAVVVQVVYTVATGIAPITLATYAAAVLAGINSGFAAGGLHDHATAAAAALQGTGDGGPANPAPAAPILAGLTDAQLVQSERPKALGDAAGAGAFDKIVAGQMTANLSESDYNPGKVGRDATLAAMGVAQAKYPDSLPYYMPGFPAAPE